MLSRWWWGEEACLLCLSAPPRSDKLANFLPLLPFLPPRSLFPPPSSQTYRDRRFLSPQGNGRPTNARGINERLAGGKERKKNQGISDCMRSREEPERSRSFQFFPAPFPIFLGTTPLGVHFSRCICPLFQSAAPLGISLHEQNLLLNFSLPTKGHLFFLLSLLSFAP